MLLGNLTFYMAYIFSVNLSKNLISDYLPLVFFYTSLLIFDSDSILYYSYALIWYIILINIFINFIPNHLSFMSYISLLYILIQSRDNKELILFRNTSLIIFQMYYFYIFSINLFINCVSKPILCFSSCFTAHLFQAKLSLISQNIVY